jgi:hypothetical protein
MIPQNSPFAGPQPAKFIESTSSIRFLDIADLSKAGVAAQKDSGEIFFAYSKHKNLGQGRLVVGGDDYLWTKRTFVNNIRRDNLEFGVNIVHYLAGGFDLGVVLAKFKGSSVDAGDKLTVITKFKNFGSAASPRTKAEVVLVTANGMAPVVDVKVLKTLRLSPLAPNKRKRIKTKVNIPGDVDPGEYLILVRVPDSDANANNNSKTSKKSLTVF